MGDCYMLTYILFTQFICKVIESLWSTTWKAHSCFTEGIITCWESRIVAHNLDGEKILFRMAASLTPPCASLFCTIGNREKK
jgi:hypothetical protein